MKINKNLKQYIVREVLPEYKKNDKGHGINHIKYVVKRSLNFAKECNKKGETVNPEMCYVIACYHDIGHHINAKEHEKISAEILKEDDGLKKFFSNEQIETMVQAVKDHRASNSNTPKSIYGKIVSSADRNTSLIQPIKRTYQYNLGHGVKDIQENLETSYEHIKRKFGALGYATDKIYFEDKSYKKFLIKIDKLLNDKNKFKKLYCKINKIKI